MASSTTQLTNKVQNIEDAEEVISALLVRFSSPTAQQRITNFARESKQSVEETTRRTASNLLHGFTPRRSSAPIATV